MSQFPNKKEGALRLLQVLHCGLKRGAGHPTFPLDGGSCDLGFVMLSLSAVVCLRSTGQCLV